MKVIRVEKGNTLYALIARQGPPEAGGVQFFTPETAPFQLGIMEHPKGHVIPAHRHPTEQYDVRTMSEVLFLEKGSIRVTIYDDEWQEIGNEVLSAGDVILLLAGGHKFEVLESCRMLEVKQGPYPGEEKAKIYRQE